MGEQLDPRIVNLTKAIALTESGSNGVPNYNAVGDAGTSKGAYQWQPGNFESAAKAAGLDPNDFSPANQNKVAYSQVKALYDRGLNPAQIAASWNAGEHAAISGSWKTNVGTTTINGQQIHYDTPGYVQKVNNYYRQLSETPSVSPSPASASAPSSQTSQQTQQPASTQTLGSQLEGRAQQGVSALQLGAQGVSELAQGNIGKGIGDTASGALQTAGAVAGGIGDVANKALELIPGVKQVEGAVGNALGGLANTSIGKQITSGIQSFAAKHPEISKDLAAAGNIASVIPMFKGVSLALQGAKDAAGLALKGSLTKAAGNEIEGVAMKTLGGQRVLSAAERKGLDPISTIIRSEALPTVETDAAGVPRYNTAQAFTNLSTGPEEAQLQQELARVGSRADLEASKQNALKSVEDAFKNRTDYDAAIKQTNAIFDSYAARFGSHPTLQELNDIKRGLRESVNFNSPKLDSDIHYLIGQSLMDDIEQTAKKDGIKGIDTINKAMASKIEAKKLLKLMDGRPVKVTKWGKWARRAKMGLGAGAGELLGTTMGIPGAGTVAGLLMEAGAAEPKTALTRLSPVPGLVPKAKTAAKTLPLLPLRTAPTVQQQ